MYLLLLFFALKLETPKIDIISGLRSLDWPGSISIVGGTLCFLFGLETGVGGLKPWESAEVVCLLVSGITILAFFVFFAAKLAKHPMIPTRIFRSRTNAFAFLTACLHSFTFISYDYFLPLYYQVVLDHSPIISGISMFAFVLPLSFLTAATGFFVRRTGNYLCPMYIGGVLLTLGTGLFLQRCRLRLYHRVGQDNRITDGRGFGGWSAISDSDAGIPESHRSKRYGCSDCRIELSPDVVL